LAVGALLFGVGGAEAHQISAVAAKASFNRDGTYRFALSLDVTGSADPALNEQISPEQAALAYLEDALRFSFDGVSFVPEFGALELVTRQDPLGVSGELVQLFTEAGGKIPPGAKEFQVGLSPETDVALVMIVVKDGITQRRAQTLFAGELSRPVDLSFVGQPVEAGDPFEAERRAEVPVPGPTEGWKAGAARMLAGNGRGALLVVALLLVGGTLARQVLLVLACWGGAVAGQVWLRLAGWEPGSGMTVAWLGMVLLAVSVDNALRGKADGRRLAFAAGCGLALGVASPDPVAGAGWGAWWGYQGGGLVVLAALALVVWVVLGPFQAAEWYRRRLVRPVSWVLAGTGVAWMAVGWWAGG
jgi:hypothetical protein